MTTHGLDEVLFSVEVTSTSNSREHWATRDWISPETQPQLRRADVIILPWENFRDDQPLLFPQGTIEFLKLLKNDIQSGTIALSVGKDQYFEITLHSNHLRIPKMLVTHAILPIVLGIIANRIDRAIPEVSTTSPAAASSGQNFTPTAELEIIVEGHQGRCISVKYKGPAQQIAETIIQKVDACLPQIEKSAK